MVFPVPYILHFFFQCYSIDWRFVYGLCRFFIHDLFIFFIVCRLLVA